MKKLSALFILFFTLNLFSQKEANFWYFGNGAALDFNSGEPVPVNGSQLNTFEGCSSFSDIDGNLLFYVGAPSPSTNNLTIWDKNNNPMPNGVGLEGDSSSSQSALTIPAPGKPNIYYLFTVGAQSSNNAGFWYYTIDMSANGGLGDIVAGPVVLGNTINHATWSEKVTAVRAKDCNTFWVISAHNNNFYAYKVNNTGVDIANPIISNISGFNASGDPRGYLKVSPDGTKLVSGNMGNGAYIFNFNDETGSVTNFGGSTFASQLNVSELVYGVEFSASSRRLYLSTGNFNASIEKLYQFDISKPTLFEINNSAFEVHSYLNTRGALQLGPNGKIYWTSNNSNFISVINKPDLLGAACDYSHLSVKIGDGSTRASQGLPPFLSSLLLPIEVKDPDTNSVINNQNLEFCYGQNKTIIPETVTGTGVTYEWFFNNGTTTTTYSTNQNLILNNLDATANGKYTLVVNLTDSCGNITKYEASFTIAVFEAAVATKPKDIIFCDTDNDGFHVFDLQDKQNTDVLDTLNATTFDVLYFENLADANSGNNPLPNPYTNPIPFSSQIIYVRVQNSFAPNACTDITEFTLAVTGLPVPTQPEPYRICDNLESSSDTDGIINTFLLNNKDSEILGTLSNSQYNISYHTSQMGAENNDIATIIDKNTMYSVTNSKTVFVRVENIDNIACYNASIKLELIVDPLPTIVPNPILDHCIAAGTSNPTVNLTLAEGSISSTPNVTFLYFTDALATNQITDPTAYPVQPNLIQSVFVKVVTDQNCSRDVVELLINVGETPDNAYADLQPPVCDDFLDANGNNTPGSNSDTDGIANFNLDKNSIINSINPPPNTKVLFFESATDRNNTLNDIDITNYRNDLSKIDISTNANGIQFPIYYKILSTVNNNCQGLGQFYVQVNSVPTATLVPDLELCDDVLDGNNTNGTVQGFDLESQTPFILGSNQSAANFTVTYHISATDANTANAALTSPFTNTVAYTQEIFVRVTNNVTGCFTNHTSFNLIVNPVPIANFVSDLEVCDDNSDGSARNGFSQTIDLESQTATILGTQDPSIYTVSYHRNLADAQNGNIPLSSPYSNLTPNRETIFVRIVNTVTGCANNISNFDVIVNSEPIFVPVSNLSYCDDDLDGDDTNGIIQNINLDSQIPSLLGATQDPDDFIVTFHTSKANASTGNAAIASPYTNTNTTETFFVRIQNKATGCVNDDASFQVLVNSLPDFYTTSPQIVCLNNTPLTIAAESPAEIYSYQWTDAAGNLISTAQDAAIFVGGSYTVTATTTNGTNCSRSETILVEESNPAILQQDFVTIVDDGNAIGATDKISISIDTIQNNIGIGDYQFALQNDDTNTTTAFQDVPIFDNLEGGIYTIIVNDKNGCAPDTTLQVSVIQFPKFFTPNADGVNDTWIVKGANKTFYPNTSIHIFNRFGKLVAQIPVDANGWNGTYNGKMLPSDDYWYNITLIPADTNKQIIRKKGHFSLIRR